MSSKKKKVKTPIKFQIKSNNGELANGPVVVIGQNSKQVYYEISTEEVDTVTGFEARECVLLSQIVKELSLPKEVYFRLFLHLRRSLTESEIFLLRYDTSKNGEVWD